MQNLELSLRNDTLKHLSIFRVGSLDIGSMLAIPNEQWTLDIAVYNSDYSD